MSSTTTATPLNGSNYYAPFFRFLSQHKGRFPARLFTAIVFILTLFSSQLSAQTTLIQARIIDENSKEPVSFSTIIFSATEGTITDNSGYFKYDIRNSQLNDSLKVSCVGYATKITPILALSNTVLDTVYLSPAIASFDEVVIKGKKKRERSSEKIITDAMLVIPDNYRTDPSLLTGYYREYLKHNNEYVNLLEAILQIEDDGIKEIDDFAARLNFKRLNTTFRIDSSLLEVYNQYTKFVPFGMIPEDSENDLSILRFADPIRNYKWNSVSHFNEFQKDFVENHIFDPRELIYLDDKPYFRIKFVDGQYFSHEHITVRMDGEIYINAEDDAIKRIKYAATLDHGLVKERLFEINLEYKKNGGKYDLHYISHNNLLKHKNFTIDNMNLNKGILMLHFTRRPDSKIALNPANYEIFTKGYKQEIESIKQDGDTILIRFDSRSMIAKNIPQDLPILMFGKRKKVKKELSEIRADLNLELNNYRDTLGLLFSDEAFSQYYQYREFFVREVDTVLRSEPDQQMNLATPVIYNAVKGEPSADTSWMNTPLVNEELRTRQVFSSVPGQNQHIEYNNERITRGNNDICYVHTDRELYAPEDTLWYKGYIRNKTHLTPSRHSDSYYIKLIDSEGYVIRKAKHLVRDSEFQGQFSLDPALDPGIYTLVGYSSWMTNFPVEEMFSKRILVKNENLDEMAIMVEYDRERYYPGDTMNIRVHVKDEFYKDIDDIKLNFNLESKDEQLLRKRINTSESASEAISYILPSDIDAIPELSIRGQHKSYDLDSSFIPPVVHELKVQFFPEGGHFLSGVESRVALKAEANGGIPIQITGKVVTPAGRILAEVETDENGTGIFTYKPVSGEIAHFIYKTRRIIGDTLQLPESIDYGWSLHAALDGRRIEVELQQTYGMSRTALLTISVRGTLVHYDVIEIDKRKRLNIPLDDIPAGIAVITIFDELMIPQGERLIYVPPRNNYYGTMGSLKESYQPRDSMFLTIKIESDRMLRNGSYSLSVVDDYMGYTRELDEANIMSSLLISPEIKGEISKPFSYINPDDPQAPERLERLLMTQGWRSYSREYEQVPKAIDRDVIFGSLKKVQFARDLEPTPGSIEIYFSGATSNLTTGENGFFSFYPVYSDQNNTDIFLNAKDARGRRNVAIILDSTQFEKDLEEYLKVLARQNKYVPKAIPETYNSFSEHFNYGIEAHQWLEEVVIRKTRVSEDKQISDYAAVKKTASLDELDQAIDMEHLTELVYVPNSRSEVIWYVIDGWVQSQLSARMEGMAPPAEVPDNSFVDNMNPRDIKSYTVIKGAEAEALYGPGKRYVIDIVMKTLGEREVNPRRQNPLVLPKYTVSKRFYSPSYRTELMRSNPFPDLRKTIYWNPRVPIDENGNAKVFYYNGDRYTRIRCILEGITSDGVPVHTEYTYRIGITRE